MVWALQPVADLPALGAPAEEEEEEGEEEGVGDTFLVSLIGTEGAWLRGVDSRGPKFGRWQQGTAVSAYVRACGNGCHVQRLRHKLQLCR